jgi:hypothetical protein
MLIMKVRTVHKAVLADILKYPNRVFTGRSAMVTEIAECKNFNNFFR